MLYKNKRKSNNKKMEIYSIFYVKRIFVAFFSFIPDSTMFVFI